MSIVEMLRRTVAANRKPQPPRRELRQKYLVDGRTLESLAKEYRVAPSTVWLWMRRDKIPLRKRGRTKPIPSREELVRLYSEKGFTIARLASHYGVAVVTVTRWLKHHAIRRRKGGPSRVLTGREEELLRLHTEDRLHPTAIARHLGVDRHTVRRFLAEKGLRPHPAPPHRKKPPPPTELLRQFYVEQQWPISKMAKHHGVRHETARRWLREAGLPIRKDQRASRPGRGVSPLLGGPDLRRWYQEEGRSPRAIAAQTDLSISTINRYLDRYDIPRRDLPAAQALRRRLPSDAVLRRLHFKEGRSAADIAREYGVGEKAVLKHLRRLRRPEDPRTVRQKEPPIDEATLRRLYVDQGLSLLALGDRVGASACAVRNWLRRYGIRPRPQGKSRRVGTLRRFQASKSDLRNLYVRQRLSLEEIARRKGVALETVRQALVRLGIPVRSHSQAAKSAKERKITRQILERLYVIKTLSLDRVGRELGVSGDTVRYWLKRYHLQVRSGREVAAAQRRPPGLPESTLRKLYEKQGLSLWDIARQAGVTPVTVKNWLVRYGISRRSLRDAAAMALRRPEIVKRRLRGFATRPTGPERRLSSIVTKYHLPLRYVGDGGLAIDGKCPDFVGTEDPRAVVEVFGSWHHPWGDAEKKRRFFSDRGYRLLVLWDHALTYPKREAEKRDAEVAQQIRQFLAGRPSG